jgi:hypothetical protein
MFHRSLVAHEDTNDNVSFEFWCHFDITHIMSDFTNLLNKNANWLAGTLSIALIFKNESYFTPTVKSGS